MTSDPVWVLLAVVLQDTLFFVLTLSFFWVGVTVLRGFGRSVGYSLAPLGFSKPGLGYFAGTALGLLIGFGALAASLLIAPLSRYVLEQLDYSTESTVQAPFMEGLSEWVGENPQVAVPAIVAVVVLFGPAAEELVFRGAVFGGLYRLGLLVSRALGALLFGPLRPGAPRARHPAGAVRPGARTVRPVQAHEEPAAVLRGARDVQLLRRALDHPERAWGAADARVTRAQAAG